MTLNRYARPVESVFALVGKNEKAITDSLAWVLDRCPTFRRALLKKITGTSLQLGELTVSTQTRGEDAGFTDIELSGSTALHLVVEAKRGWTLPSETQLRKYAGRLSRNGLPAKLNFLVSMSECSDTYARLFLPKAVKGIAVRHLSWSDVLNVCDRSRRDASSAQEKGWLNQLADYLKGIATMQDVLSNKVYVVSLSNKEIHKGSGYTWIDVVAKDRCYFHPVGNTWPLSPPNYVAFRYNGRLQSIHHVQRSQVSNYLHKLNKKWPKTHRPHFVYKLGRPIRPPLDIALGNLWANARLWCLIDTLLTGKYKTVKDAHEASKKRLKQAGVD